MSPERHHWAYFALAWFNRSPLLCLSRTRGSDSKGQVVVMNTACEELAASELLADFGAATRAYLPSPDDRLLAGMAQKNNAVVLLDAGSCDKLMELRLTEASPVLQGYACFWSPDSSRVAVAVVLPDSGGASSLRGLFAVDAAERELLVSLDESYAPIQAFSGVHGWCSQGLICTLHPPAGSASAQHRIALVPLSLSGVITTDALALTVNAHCYDFVCGRETMWRLTAHVALSPCGAFLAVVCGQDLAVWGVQVVRASSGRKVAEWQAPFDPCEQRAERAWSITWSLDCRSISVGVDANRPAYSATYLLALGG